MMKLADWELSGGKRIELFWGDLSYLPPEHAVDVLVVSAFPDDYVPTPTSLIGALYRNGVNVERLSFAKERDMRSEYSCWLSERLLGINSFGRILCVESGWRGKPPQLAADMFRAIASCTLTEFPHRTIAMPLIGTGDQGYPADQIMGSILDAALAWLKVGMPIDVLKVVAYSAESAEAAKKRFLEVKRLVGGAGEKQAGRSASYDLFFSYAHEDHETIEDMLAVFRRERPGIRVFMDSESIRLGSDWVMKLANALDSSDRILALFTPKYWASPFCLDELAAGYIRQRKLGKDVLCPIYFKTAEVPSLFQALQYADCHEGDGVKLSRVCQEICKSVAR